MNLSLRHISASGLEEISQEEAAVAGYLRSFADLLRSEHEKIILIPKPMPITLTAGAGDNGDVWSFSLTAPRKGLSVKPNPRTSRAWRHLDANYDLCHFQFVVPYGSVVRRQCRIDKCCGRNSTLMVLPPHICKRISSALSITSRAGLLDAIERLQCLLLDTMLEEALGDRGAYLCGTQISDGQVVQSRTSNEQTPEELLRFQ